MEPPRSCSWSSLRHGAPRRAMTSVSVSNHSGSVSTSSPSMSNSTAARPSVTRSPSVGRPSGYLCSSRLRPRGPVRSAAPQIWGYGGSSPREIWLCCAPDMMAVFAIGRATQPLDAEVPCLRVVDDDRVGGLLRVELHLLREFHADA